MPIDLLSVSQQTDRSIATFVDPRRHEMHRSPVPATVQLHRRLLAAGAAAIVAVRGLTAMPARAAGPVLTAQVVQTSVWSTGYGADVVITNTGGTASTSWVVEFDLPSGTTVSSS